MTAQRSVAPGAGAIPYAAAWSPNGALVELLLVLLLVVAAAAAVVVVMRRRARSRPRERGADPLAGGSDKLDALRAIDVGFIVGLDGAEHVCRGALKMRDAEGYRWREVLLASEAPQRWLSVEETDESPDGLEIAVWTRGRVGDFDAEPGARTLTRTPDGVRFTLDERGEAQFTADGTTGTADSGRMRYADYEGPGGELLSCEDFGAGWEVSAGRALRPADLDMVLWGTAS